MTTDRADNEPGRKETRVYNCKQTSVGHGDERTATVAVVSETLRGRPKKVKEWDQLRTECANWRTKSKQKSLDDHLRMDSDDKTIKMHPKASCFCDAEFNAIAGPRVQTHTHSIETRKVLPPVLKAPPLFRTKRARRGRQICQLNQKRRNGIDWYERSYR